MNKDFKFAKQPLKSGDDCCSVQPKGKVKCPLCGNEAKGVLVKTLNALLKDETKQRLDFLEGFYYCKTFTCKAIYFRGNETLDQKDVSVSVGLKESASVKNYCYCFGWTEDRMIEDIKTNGKSNAITDIQFKMKSIGSSCEVKNPSGKCCQVDVKKVVESLEG